MAIEAGAGQWSTAWSMACKFFNLTLEVYMVRASYDQKPYRCFLMETYGAKVYPSPSNLTSSGWSILAQDPARPGSLGIAISEAVEVAAASGGAKKVGLGYVLNHVLFHQTVIDEEARKQMDLADEYPDIVIGCVGGGSNFSGTAFHFLRENLKNRRKTWCLAVESTATPSLTRGFYSFDYGDTAHMARFVKKHTLDTVLCLPLSMPGGYAIKIWIRLFAHSLMLELLRQFLYFRYLFSKMQSNLPRQKVSSLLRNLLIQSGRQPTRH
jgi:tryptophan synthase beta chain